MISPVIQDQIKKIEPLMEPAIAAAMDRKWRALSVSTASMGGFVPLVSHYAIVRATDVPVITRKALYILCADHGVADEKVSAMTCGSPADRASALLRGDAPVNALGRHYGIEVSVIDAGLRGAALPGSLPYRSCTGSANLTKAAALSHDQTNAAMEAGLALAADAASRFDVVALAHLGAGVTTAASAVFAALTGRDAAETTPRPGAISDATYAAKLNAVRGGIARHGLSFVSPFGVLAGVGGPDLAMATGFILGAALHRLPVVIDCFAGASAALAARSLCADSLDAAIFANGASDPAHQNLLTTLDVSPQIAFGLASARGCAAAIAIHMLESGIKLFHEIAEAGARTRYNEGLA